MTGDEWVEQEYSRRLTDTTATRRKAILTALSTHTIPEVAQQFGITRERVRQIKLRDTYYERTLSKLTGLQAVLFRRLARHSDLGVRTYYALLRSGFDIIDWTEAQFAAELSLSNAGLVGATRNVGARGVEILRQVFDAHVEEPT